MLVLVMVLAMAACDTAKPDPTDTTKATENSGETQPTGETEKEREHVELVVYNYVNGSVLPGMEETMEAVNAYLKEKLNTTIDLHLISSPEYSSTASTVLTSGSDVDFLFTRATYVNFLQYANMNAFLPLEDYVDEYLPATKALLPESAWDALTVNGHLYAVPMQRDAATRYDITVNTTLADDLGLTIPESFCSLYDLNDLLYTAKAARDAKYPEKTDQPIVRHLSFNIPAYFPLDPILVNSQIILAANVPGLDGVEGMGNGEKLYCPYLTDEFREMAKWLSQLVKDGIIPYDPDSYDTDRVLESAGEFLFKVNSGNVYVDEDANMPYYKSKLVTSDHAVLATSNLMHGYAVAAQSKHIERCLEVIDLLNTDPYLATVMRFGPEGVSWTDEDGDNMIELTDLNSDSTNRYWYYWYQWNFGGLTSSKVPPTSTQNFGELLTELNSNATPSANIGFVMDQTPVENEITACVNVIAEYYTMLTRGQCDDVDAYLDEFIQKLKDNGIEKIIAEGQAQLDAWRAANG